MPELLEKDTEVKIFDENNIPLSLSRYPDRWKNPGARPIHVIK